MPVVLPVVPAAGPADEEVEAGAGLATGEKAASGAGAEDPGAGAERGGLAPKVGRVMGAVGA
jgi:hypothetical protein